MKFAFYPNGCVALMFENGFALIPSAKVAAKFLRQWANEVEAHGEANKSTLMKEFGKAWEAAGFDPPSPPSAEVKDG
jgi:hypothetical protein